jgi:YcaO-like protein with predicted kinase domain
MDNLPLESFYTERADFERIRDTTDSAYLEDVQALVERLKTHGITQSHISTEDFEVFSHQGVADALAGFIEDNPHCEIPLKRITLIRYVRADTCRDDLTSIRRQLADCAERMEHFTTRLNVEVLLHIFLEALDAERALGVARCAATRAVDDITFVFRYPPPTRTSAAAIASALSRLCSDPILKNTKVKLSNFPFCFAPPDKYKALYRHPIGDLLKRVSSQRGTIASLRAQDFAFHEPCLTCRCRKACYAFTDIEDHPQYAPFLSPRAEDTVVFAGGSLHESDRSSDGRIVFTAPTRQGDMLTAVIEGFENILIIDGYFYSTSPCTTFEVMLALENGVNVFGASSTGALRAVELDRYGLQGCGTVYEYLKSREIKPYHIVAQTYDENDRPLTTPLVEIIYFLARALADGIIDDTEREACLLAADHLHFTSLTFEACLQRWEREQPIGRETAARLRDYYADKGADEFAVKRKDALLLLGTFRQALADRAPDYVKDTFSAARDRHLGILYAKYPRGHARVLPADWRRSSGRAGVAGNTRDNRELTPQQTCELAGDFFQDLDVTLADTTRYDPAQSHIISIFFIPFYFLGYPRSCATGSGHDFTQALASAYMELVERIPMCAFRIDTLRHSELDQPPFPAEEIPHYYNWRADQSRKRRAAQAMGYVAATDILTDRDVYIPRFAAMSLYSGSDGNAAGNSPAEAILYGVYELIERDTNRIYLRDISCRRLEQHLLMDPEQVADEQGLALLARFEAKGCRLLLSCAPNIYGIPCVRCRVYDQGRKMECHGGAAARADLRAAVRAALHEAYLRYITYFCGLRDDYGSLADVKDMRIAYDNARALLTGTHRTVTVPATGVSFGSVGEELDAVVHRLTDVDIRHILVVNTSPTDVHAVKSLKVIIPRLELWFVEPYQPSPWFRERARRTREAARALIGDT